ncbi:MAG: hypothetical protein CMO34_04550 [Verrucomicrobia bacterium]|nr:hypothetical protein [Verrucomicrobiota bacterium]|tara:strand:+ start:457 stop:1020 length:564 start_codon:yes stop_codon:yes gene_type:complete
MIYISVCAQIDEYNVEEYYIGFPFEEGIYQSFDEFKSNQPGIQLAFEVRKSELFIENDSTDEMIRIDPYAVWGYSKAGNVYISVEGGFWRIINMGSLAHFTAVIVTTFQTVDAFGFPMTQSSKRLEHMFLDTETSEVKALSSKEMQEYVDQEPILASQKNKLKNKPEKLIVVLKAYNKLNPLYFYVE